jgi:adenylate cyclase
MARTLCDGDAASARERLRHHLAARSLNAIAPEQYPHGSMAESEWLVSPFHHLIDRARAHEHNPSMRRRLSEGPDLRDFPVVVEFYGEGATDYVAYLFELGGDRSQETWVVYSFSTDQKGGFRR